MPKRRNLVRPALAPVAGLKTVAHWLNRLPELEGAEAAAWRAAERVVSAWVRDPGAPGGRTLLGLAPSPSLQAAAWEFNRWAKGNPAHLAVRFIRSKRGRVVPFPDLAFERADTYAGFAAWFLWRFFFADEGWLRLKRCPQCRRWFVDETKNHKKDRCSMACTWRWWNLDRRRRAGHKALGGKRRPTGRRGQR